MKWKTLISLLMCAALVLTLLPITARAAEAGDFIVEGGTLGTHYTYDPGGGALIFGQPGTYTVSMKTPGTPTTASQIQIAPGAGTETDPVVISLNGVSIHSGSCAFELKENSYAELILMEGTTSQLTSVVSAGISCLQDATLIIRGTGTLEARGGNNFAAGIGSGNTGACGNIIIRGGTVHATGGDHGAGIGWLGNGIGGVNGGMIEISGGTVHATGGNQGAGIGGSWDASGGTIKISGGTVYATGRQGAGIGGGYWGSGSSVEISGGTVYATSDNGAGIGGGYGGSGGTVNISGGSVLAVGGGRGSAGGGAGIGGGGAAIDTGGGTGGMLSITGGSVKITNGGSGAPEDGMPATPKGGDGTTNVYLTTVTLQSAADGTAVTQLVTDPSYLYGLNGVKTDGDGKLFLYLPESTQTTAAQTASSRYVGSVTTTTDSTTSLGTLLPDVSLSGLGISRGTLSPVFAGGTYAYTASVENSVSSLTVTPAANDANATITVNGTAVASGGASPDIALSVGDNIVTIIVRAQNGDTQTYTVTVTRAQSSGGGSGTTYYTIKATAGTGGSISPSGSSSVAYGGSKTYTIAADEGYEIEDVLVDGASVGAVSSYTFENVNKPRTIAAFFKKTQTINPFSDIKPGDWFYDNVLFVYGNGLMNGTASGLFSPNGTMTRGMLVTVLYCMSGDTVSYTNAFSDVPSGAWYEDAAAWAAANKIAGGTGDGRFAPDREITREQLAVMLYNYAKYKGYDVSVGEDTNILSYNDALTISDYAYAALQWACGAGIIGGDTSGNLNPRSGATRAEAAAMLQRFIENVAG